MAPQIQRPAWNRAWETLVAKKSCAPADGGISTRVMLALSAESRELVRQDANEWLTEGILMKPESWRAGTTKYIEKPGSHAKSDR